MMLKKVLSIILMNIFLAVSSLIGAGGAWADKGGEPNTAASEAPAKGHQDGHSQGKGHLDGQQGNTQGKGHEIHEPNEPPGQATAF